MNRHITSEVLSAYLDFEVDLPVRRTVERHLESCEECRSHLVSMQRVVHGLGRVERMAPPLALAAQIRRQAAEQPPITFWGRCKELFLDLPRRSEMRTHLTMAMGLFVCVFLVGHGIERQHLENLALQQEPVEDVTYILGGTSLEAWGNATSEVAGRKFELVDNVHWVQQGVPFNHRDYARIDPQSPEGQAFVRRYDNLDTLLSGGSTVLMVDEATMTLVELSTSRRS
ncbi:MAG TPA: zf-HC2 domain-containing protein [Thermoanaerobaculia bacterium]|nr:zf-HC2 domain-containing protein [Thermoanaerobaculia bacterium]